MKYMEGVHCPSCGADWILRIHRGFLGKLLRPNSSKYLCDVCGKVFYAPQPPNPIVEESEAG